MPQTLVLKKYLLMKMAIFLREIFKIRISLLRVYVRPTSRGHSFDCFDRDHQLPCLFSSIRENMTALKQREHYSVIPK